jgi:hypothetical protein
MDKKACGLSSRAPSTKAAPSFARNGGRRGHAGRRIAQLVRLRQSRRGALASAE